MGSGSFLKLAKGSNNETIGGLTGSGIVRAHEGVANATAILTIANSADHTFSGILQNGGASGTTLSLVKSGSGKQTLSGANTLQTITINEGTLAAGSSTAFGSSAIILNGGSLDANGETLTNEISITSGFVTGSGTYNGALTGLGNLVKTGNGTVTLGAANSYVNTVISGGTLTLAGSGTFGSGTVSVGVGGTLDLAGIALNSDIELNGGTLTGAANMTSTANVNVIANSALSGSLGGNIQLGTTSPRTLDIAGGLTVAGTISGSGSFIGGNLTVQGTHAVGNSPGYQSITGDLTYGENAVFDWEFDNIDSWTFTLVPLRSSAAEVGDYDAVDVIGNLTITPGAYLRILPLPDELSVYANPFWLNTVDGMTFQIFAATDTITGMFTFENGSNTLSLPDGLGTWTLRRENLAAGETTGIYITYAIPEPSTYGLMLGGLALAAAAWRRRKSVKASAPEIKPLS